MLSKKNFKSEYRTLLEKAALLPKGKYLAVCYQTHHSLGIPLSRTERTKGPYDDPVRAMKKAKRMAEWMDFLTIGLDNGIKYGIREVKDAQAGS